MSNSGYSSGVMPPPTAIVPPFLFLSFPLPLCSIVSLPLQESVENCPFDNIQTQKLMFDLLASSSLHAKQERKEGHSSRYMMQSQRFIPPTHPAYLVTPSFDTPHTLALQEECDRLYIPLGMQTGKKKLMRVPDFPQDRFFIIADDSLGPTLLEGEFLMLKSKVVGYPRANSLEQVMEAFKEYIGLGHYETTEQYYQNNGKNEQVHEENRQTTVLIRKGVETEGSQMHTGISSLVANLDRHDVVKSALSTYTASKIELREVSSLKAESKISRGKLYIYDNMKDNAEFKAMVSELRTRFASVSYIKFIERIDQYNNDGRLTKQHDNVVLMSHYSFLNLSKYFLKYHSFALFLTQEERIDLFRYKHVAMATSKREKIFVFIEMFLQGRSQIGEVQGERPKGVKEAQREKEKKREERPLLGHAQDKGTVQHVPLPMQMKELKTNMPSIQKQKPLGTQIPLRNLPPSSSNHAKPQIQLVRVTDLPKDAVKRMKSQQKPTVPYEDSKKGETIPPSTAVNSHPNAQTNSPRHQPIVPVKTVPKGQKMDNSIPLSPTIPVSYDRNHVPAMIPKETNKLHPEQEPLSHLIVGNIANDISFENRSEHTKKSKIKRLKSAKKLRHDQQEQIQPEPIVKEVPFSLQPHEKQPQAGFTRRTPQNPLTTHLRMGSDDNNSRSKSRPPQGHTRSHSDSEHFPLNAPQIKISVPIPASESEPNEYYSVPPEEKCQIRQPRQRKGPQGREVSIRVLASVKEKESSKQLSIAVPMEQQKKEGNIMSSIRRPKGPNNMAEKIGSPNDDNEEKAIVRKPKARFTVKEELKSFCEQEQVEMEEQEQLVIMAHPVPKDEVQLQRMKNRMKVNADQYNIEGSPKHSRKVLKARAVPPSFQTVTASQIEAPPMAQAKGVYHPSDNLSRNDLSHQDGHADDEFDTPAISNISSIPPKNDGGKAKRFTFGGDAPQDYYGISGGKRAKQALKTPVGKISNSASPENPSGMAYGIDTPVHPPSEPSPFRPNKSRSMQQVTRVFNRFKSKPVEQFTSAPQNKADRQDSRRSSRSSLSKEPNSGIRPGKIYSNLKCKAEQSRMGHSPSPNYTPSKISSHSTPYAPFKDSQQSSPVLSMPPTYQLYRNKGIQDLIDLSKYDRVIENGVVVYRSKYPIQVTQYTPTQIITTPRGASGPERRGSPQIVTVSALITPEIKDYPREDPYGVLPHAKQNRRPVEKNENTLKRSKSGATPLVRYCPKDSEKEKPKDQTGGNHNKTKPNTQNPLGESLVQPYPIHPPTKKASLSPKPVLSHLIPSSPQKRRKQRATPIQDMLASKLSSSNQGPMLIHDMHLPAGRDSRNSHSSASSHKSSSPSHSQTGRMVLYLIDKRQSSSLFEQLGGVRSRKDSLLTFKNEKQLSQQLPQTIHVYDIVYVIPMHPSTEIEAVTKEYQNVFVVEVREGKTKIKGNRVALSSLKYLGDVSELLLKQRRPTRRALKNKGRTYISPGRIEERSHHFDRSRHFSPSCCHQQVCHCPHVSILTCRQ